MNLMLLFLIVSHLLSCLTPVGPHISPENRTWLQEGGQGGGGGGRRRLNIAGKSFLVDDDGNEVEESGNRSEYDGKNIIHKKIQIKN